MNCNQVYICVTIGIILYYIFSQHIAEGFVGGDNYGYWGNYGYSRFPFLAGISTRNMPIYQDIRGSPNAAYTIDSFGTITHFGYKFGPFLYDTQGNRIKYMKNSYYVS
jgi:hypothetical protein